MSSGPGRTQRFVLNQLGRGFALPLRLLAERYAADVDPKYPGLQRDDYTRAHYESIARAVRKLEDGGLIDAFLEEINEPPGRRLVARLAGTEDPVHPLWAGRRAPD